MRYLAAPLILVAAIALAGCSGTTTAASSSQHSHKAKAPAAQQAAPAPTPTPPASFAFGDTATFSDGVTISISAPTPYTPVGTDTAGLTFPHDVRDTVTIHNGSTTPIDQPAYVTVATSGGQSAPDIFDESTVNQVPAVTILSGQSLTYPIGFSVADPSGLTVTYSLDWDTHADVTFTTDPQ
jgi:hypothetical protein